jgi:protocatechuate 3,4-dioxygenase beta subunit
MAMASRAWFRLRNATVVAAALWAVAGGPGPVTAGQRAGGTPRDNPAMATTAPGGAGVAGVVFSAADGTPLRGAQVQFTGQGNAPLSTLTDAQGRYRLTGVPAGSWTARASKAGYVPQQSGTRHPAQPARPFQIAARGEYSLDFALVRGAAISGEVTNAAGEPLAGVRVEALRSRVVRGHHQPWKVVASDLTDDTGAFRLHTLPPGEYFVSASLRAGAPDEQAALIVGGLPSYYPGTAVSADAQRIPLAVGQQRSGVSFAVTASTPVRVSGHVVNNAGTGVDGASVELLNASDLTVVARPFGNFGLTHPDGAFTLINVAPGPYILTAETPGKAGRETAFVPFTVTAGDVNGVALVTSPGVRVNGTIAAAPGESLPARMTIEIRARSGRRDDERTASVAGGLTSFALHGLLGPYTIDVDGMPPGWRLVAVELNGRDVTDTMVDFGPSGVMTARVVVTSRSGEVSGTVRSTDRFEADADVLIFPEDAARWAYPSRLVRTTRTDASGRFRVSGLAPSAYRGIALDFLNEGDEHDVELLNRLRARATPFSVGVGEKQALELEMRSR